MIRNLDAMQAVAAGVPAGTPAVAQDAAGLLVTIATGEIVAVSPHPSGIPGLPPLVLHGGATLRVSAEDAEELFQRRRVLSPVTGEVKPPDPPPAPYVPGVFVSYGNGPRRSAEAGAHLSVRDYADPEREALEKYDRERAAEKAANPGNYGFDREGRRPVRIVGGFDPLGPIAGVDY